MSTINLKVNGRDVTVDVEPTTPLLYILRNDLELNGPKFGCGLGQCGACTVIVEGEAYRSCITPVRDVEGVAITTLEGIGSIANMHPIQLAFLENNAAQCGYCINGMIMTAKAFVDQNPGATEDQIIAALDANLCRCGTHQAILAAVKQYAQEVSV
jgi:nicotinate dehydrogenase subunit A